MLLNLNIKKTSDFYTKLKNGIFFVIRAAFCYAKIRLSSQPVAAYRVFLRKTRGANCLRTSQQSQIVSLHPPRRFAPAVDRFAGATILAAKILFFQ